MFSRVRYCLGNVYAGRFECHAECSFRTTAKCLFCHASAVGVKNHQRCLFLGGGAQACQQCQAAILNHGEAFVRKIHGTRL